MKRIYLLLAAVLLTACDGAVPLAEFKPPVMEYRVETRNGFFKVREFRLSDGTRCVALYSDAITCEWRPAIQIMPRVE